MKILLILFVFFESFLGLDFRDETKVLEEAIEYVSQSKVFRDKVSFPTKYVCNGIEVSLSFEYNSPFIDDKGVITTPKANVSFPVVVTCSVSNKKLSKEFNCYIEGKDSIDIFTDVNDFYEGELTELTLKEEYNRKDYKWISSDESVVEIDEDYLAYFLKPGTAIISIYDKDNVKKGSITIEVLPKKLLINSKEKYYLCGETFKLDLTNYYDRYELFDCVFDESLLHYNNGTFTVKGAGTTKIKYVLKQDNRIFDSLTITLYPITPIIQVISNEITVGERIRISVINYDNEDDYIISSSNDNVIVDGKYLQAIEKGKSKIRVSLKSDTSVFQEIDIFVSNIMPYCYFLRSDILVDDSTYIHFENLDKLLDSDINNYVIQNLSPNVIALDDFLVTGKSVGKGTLKIYSKKVSDLEAIIEVNVVNKPNSFLPNGEVSSGPLIISLSDNKDIYKCGEMLKIEVEGLRDYSNYNLTITDNEIGNILDSGFLILKKEGIASIVISSNADRSIKGSIKIIVKGKIDVDYPSRLIEIARKELGYKELPNGNTKYGIWYGIDDGAWCAMYVTWCAYYSGISTNVIPHYCGCTAGWNWFVENDCYGLKGEYTPKKGDIIFFLSDGASHTGIVTGCKNNVVYTIEGNTSNMVAERSYSLSHSTITGYGIPRYNLMK